MYIGIVYKSIIELLGRVDEGEMSRYGRVGAWRCLGWAV